MDVAETKRDPDSEGIADPSLDDDWIADPILDPEFDGAPITVFCYLSFSFPAEFDISLKKFIFLPLAFIPHTRARTQCSALLHSAQFFT